MKVRLLYQSLFLGAACVMSTAAQADSHSGPAVEYVQGPYVGPNGTTHVQVVLNMGATQSGTHFGIGGRGYTIDNPIGQVSGRGIALGDVWQARAGGCSGVMIEDFAENHTGTPHDGLVPGTCVPFTFQPYQDYMVDVLISRLNVYWYVSEWRWISRARTWGWVFVAEGGCYEDTGTFCPEAAFDVGHNDAFVAGPVPGYQTGWFADGLTVNVW